MKTFCFLLLGCLLAGPVQAVDSMGISRGEGSEQVEAFRVSARWQWPYRWLQRGDWLFTGYWEAGLGHWKNDVKVSVNKPLAAAATHEILVTSFTPVFRWQRGMPDKHGFMPFLEAGIGAGILSNKRLARDELYPRRFGTRLQFEFIVGIGNLFGERNEHELNLRKYHYSNADFNKLNEAMDLWMLSYSYWLK